MRCRAKCCLRYDYHVHWKWRPTCRKNFGRACPSSASTARHPAKKMCERPSNYLRGHHADLEDCKKEMKPRYFWICVSFGPCIILFLCLFFEVFPPRCLLTTLQFPGSVRQLQTSVIPSEQASRTPSIFSASIRKNTKLAPLHGNTVFTI